MYFCSFWWKKTKPWFWWRMSILTMSCSFAYGFPAARDWSTDSLTGTGFTGQMTQPTASKHWRKIGSQGLGFNPISSTSPCYITNVQLTKKYTHIAKAPSTILERPWDQCEWRHQTRTVFSAATLSVQHQHEHSPENIPLQLFPELLWRHLGNNC